MNLTGNKILITGGTSGIGRELALALKEKGNEVIVTGRNEEKLSTAKEDGLHTIMCDLQNQNDIEQVVTIIENEHPDLNMLINNAGVQFNYSYTDAAIPFERIKQEIDVNVTGQLLLTQMVLPLLCNKKKAFIINTTSGLGAFPKSDGLVYSASKAAMRNFTVGLRYALKGTSVKVMEFIPPVTDTGMTAGRAEKKMSTGELIAKVLPQIEKEKSLITVPAMRIFLLLSFLFPGIAHKILSKQ